MAHALGAGRGGRGGGRRQVVAGLAAAGASALAGLPRAFAQQGRRRGPAVFDVTRFGAVGDGKTAATRALQRALDACRRAGGGVVLVPPGRYLTGALFLCNNLRLDIVPGAVLVGSPRFDDYPAVDSRSDGIEGKCYASMLTGQGLENVTITGGGALDGNGPPWWQAYEVVKTMRTERKLGREAANPAGSPLRWPRPRIINLIRSQGVVIRDVTLRESPFWSVHLVYCQDVLIDGVTIAALQARHIDGVIVDSCKQIRISGCSISAGSDSVALKAGYNEDGRRVGLPCEDVLISNCNFSNSVGAGISLGSETAGGIRNVAVDNCTITRCRYGVHVRSPRGRGGVIERVRMSNLIFDKIDDAALMISHFYDSVRMDSLFGDATATGNPETDRRMKAPIGEGTPSFRDLVFSGLSLGAVPTVAVVEGLPERHIQGLVIRDVTAPEARTGVLCARSDDMHIDRLRMNPSDGPAVAAREVERLNIEGLICPRPGKRAPIVRLEGAAGVLVHDCDIGPGAAEFVRAEGPRNRDITLIGNKLPPGLKNAG